MSFYLLYLRVLPILLLLCYSAGADAQTDSTAIKLQQYKEWHDKGIITEKEYQELKNKVLNPISEPSKEVNTPATSNGGLKNGHYKGVRGGLSVGFMGVGKGTKAAIGPSVAVFYQYYHNHLVLIAELGFSQKGYSTQVQFTDAQGNNLSLKKQTFKFGFIEIPMLAGVRLNTVNIFGGISHNINIYGKAKTPSVGGGNANYYNYDVTLSNRYEAALVLGLSNDFVIAHKFAIPLEARYGVGLNSPKGARFQTFTISTGFKF